MRTNRWWPAVTAVVAAGCLAPEALVPPTVVDDPNLPSRTIEVRGRQRRIHLREFGEAGAPVMLVVHSSSADIRAYLPLAALADRYRVVMWDLRGNGLSERVPREELGFEAAVEELEAVRQLVAPGQRVTLLGHSWGAVISAMYLARQPDAVAQAVLIEPPGLTREFRDRVGLAIDLTVPGYLDLVWSTEGLSARDHDELDYQLMRMLKSNIRNFFCDPRHPPEWPVWRPGGLALAAWEMEAVDGPFARLDLRAGLAAFPRKVLLVGTACSPIGTGYQRATNQTLFADAEVLHVPDAGHRVVVEQLDLLLAGLRAYLNPDVQRGAP